MKNDIEFNINQAISWLLHSGIQDKNGGVFSWYNNQSKKHDFYYSEITGYAITMFLYLYKITNDKIFLFKAEKGADWLIKFAINKDGSILTRKYLEKTNKVFSFEGKNVFLFDNAMVLIGLCYLFRETKNIKYFNSALKVGEFIRNIFFNNNDIIQPIYNLKSKKFISNESKWSFQIGSFLNKIAIGFFELKEITNNYNYNNLAIEICKKSFQYLNEEKLFITNKKKNLIEIHPLCYSIEGLFFIGVNNNIKEFIDISKYLSSWLLDIYIKNKEISESFDPIKKKFSNIERSDIYGQFLRILLLCELTNNKITQSLINKIISYQLIDSENRQNGGFFYDTSKNYINSWSTMFNLQSMLMVLYKDSVRQNNKIELII